MKQLASVVIENGKPMAEVIRPEACEACHACKYGRTERRLIALPEGDYHEGQQVELELKDGRVGAASLLAYGIPLVLLVIGLLVGAQLFQGELQQALCALGGVAVGLGILRLIEPLLKRSGGFAPQACPCDEQHNPKE